MFCSRCGKTLMPEDKQCPHCGTPVGESRFEGTPYTSAQPHILPNTPAGQASLCYRVSFGHGVSLPRRSTRYARSPTGTALPDEKINSSS